MFQKIKLARNLNKALGQIERIRTEADTMDTKTLLSSKTFWLNVLGLAVTVSNILPQKYGMPVLAVANIAMRLVTNQPVGIFPDKSGQ